MISRLDHINIRTNHLQRMTEFYRDALSLRLGPRPDFSFDGAWLYCGDQAVVHLVETRETLNNEQAQIEHFALKGEDFDQITDHLDNKGISYRVSPVPGYALTQIHLADPDGNHIEINFDGTYG